MLIGYSSFLRKLAMVMDPAKGLTASSMAYKLNLRHDELCDLLIIMQSKGDIETVKSNDMEYKDREKTNLEPTEGQKCKSYDGNMIYRMTEKGRSICK